MNLKTKINFRENKKTCIIVGLLVLAIAMLGLGFFINNMDTEAKTVYIATTNISAGEEITSNMIAKANIKGSGLPNGYFLSNSDIVGSYAVTDINKEDIINSVNISKIPYLENDYYANLGDGAEAISVSIKTLAKGLSSKLQSGDIVSIFVVKDEESFLPEEFRYVEVIAVTDAKGVDGNTGAATSSESTVSTVTLLVNKLQAKMLALYEETASMHFSLVCRGNEEAKEEYLAEQKEIFKELYPEYYIETEDEVLENEDLEINEEIFEESVESKIESEVSDVIIEYIDEIDEENTEV